jgi:GGDEF domain-containing protein
MNLTAEQVGKLFAVGGGREEGPVSAEDRTGVLFSAAHAAATSGVPVFYVQFKVEGLASLNAELGHSGADAALVKARSAIGAALEASAGDVTEVKDRAAAFGYLVVGSDARTSLSALEKSSEGIAVSVGENLGMTLSAAVMDADDAATSAVLGDRARDASAGGAIQAQPPTTARKTAPVFTSTGADRQASFAALAASFGLGKAQTEELYGILVSSRADPLTGFERAADREGTAKKAAAHVARTGSAAVYAELDVRNLGGLNAAVGRKKADEIFARIARIATDEMNGVAHLGDAWPFRHGGDEMSFIVVARRPGIGAPQLEFAVAAALTRAAIAVKTATADVAEVPHTKKGSPPGTGIAWGTSVIGADAAPADVFSEADRKVEMKKAQGARWAAG